MRRENKLALIIGFSVLLVVAVLVSDHLSQASREEVRDGLDTLAKLPEEGMFFETPLSADRRATEPPAAMTTTDAPPTTRVTARPPEPDPVPAPVETRLADHTEILTPVVEPTPHPEPVIVSNGPAAHRLADRGKTGNAQRPDLLGIDPSKIRALLETARTRPAGRDETPRDGLIPSARKYVVQPGDTLYEIAQRLYGDGERWPEIAARNKGKVGANGTVYVGVTLDLPPGVRDAARTTRPDRPGRSAAAMDHRAPSKKTAPRPASGTRKYVVKKGDTLSQIAQREVGSVRFLDKIRELNPSLKKNRDRIFVGQVLVLPSPRG